MLSLSQLRNPATRNEVTAEWIEILQGLGFQTSGWNKNSVAYKYIKAACTFLADYTELAKPIAEWGFNKFASGVPLTLYSESRYNNIRKPAIRARGKVELTSAATVPYQAKAGQLLFSDDAGHQFRNVADVSVPAAVTENYTEEITYQKLTYEVDVDGNVVFDVDGNPIINAEDATIATEKTRQIPGKIEIYVEATLAGAGHNLPPDEPVSMLTPLAGVTAVARFDASDPGYIAGADEESDALLKERNRTKWATQSLEMVADGYRYYALSADGVEKVSIDDNNPRGENTIDVYVSGAADLLGEIQLQALQETFAKRVFGTSTQLPPAPGVVHVLSAYPSPLDLAGTVYHDPSASSADVQAAVEAALRDFIRVTPIGGYDFSPGPANVVTLGDIIAAIEGVTGVRTVTLTSPTATVSVGVRSLVMEGDWSSLSYVAVAE